MIRQRRPAKRNIGIERHLKRHPSAESTLQDSGEDVLRFVALGGLEEIGRNMSFFEYQNEIVLVDMGIQFPEEETPGIDYIIPNVSYLEKKKENVKALIITHGHYDHIGAIPYLIGKVGNPVIYTSELSRQIIEKRQTDFPNAPKLNFQVYKPGDVFEISKYFKAEFFGVFHNIPESLGFVLTTPVGKMVSLGDFKLDYDANREPVGIPEYERIGKQKIHTLFLDSTNALEDGRSVSERDVEKHLEEIFRKAPGRIITATFASLLTRIVEIVKIVEKLNRKIALIGYSMKVNFQIAQNLGYTKPKKDTMIPIEEVQKYPDNKVFILTTGAQGEPQAGLMRIVNGEHPNIKIKKSDTVIFSSSVIPGNERSVQLMQDNLSRQGARIYNEKILDIHSSGHAPQDELEQIMGLIKPKFVVPIHGYHNMRSMMTELGEKMGIPRENVIIADNGKVCEATKNSFTVTEKLIDASYVMVDGLGVGDVEEVVLRDRRLLSQEGMVVIIMTLNRSTGRLLKSPDVISRGFIYLRENKEILEEIRKRLRGIIARIPNQQQIEADYLKTLIRDQVGQVIYNQTKRRPMILPVIIEI